MPRVVRWVAIAVCCLLGAAPAARADGPTPTITANDRSSPAKGLGSESRDAATGDIIVGDPGPGREPRLITPSPQNLEIALDGPADSLRASLGGVNARVTQTSALTYTVEVPESQALPVFLGLAITSTYGSWTTHAGWGLELARSPAPMFATPWSAAVRPALLSATEGPRTGSVLIADGFGLNPPTLRVAPGAIVTVTLTGWVNGLTAHAG